MHFEISKLAATLIRAYEIEQMDADQEWTFENPFHGCAVWVAMQDTQTGVDSHSCCICLGVETVLSIPGSKFLFSIQAANVHSVTRLSQAGSDRCAPGAAERSNPLLT